MRLSNDFMMATEVLLFMRRTLGLLTVAIPKIVKATEEADAAHEFITYVANDVKPKLVRKEANYMVSENNVAIARALL
ncbi:hypothetical protein HZH68_016243 [Vespula germanica]|uniref:Uncharacterized protein n=1 Tax=Vespula germanica TaxID=30212 RepID=A0A834J1Z4_VESGE|nr:hypothetical protein HZH68_016243 [Vespula germanica]